MAVAVKNTPEIATSQPVSRLAATSLAGVAYVLGVIGIVFYAIPNLWERSLGVALAGMSFVNYTLLGVVMLACAAGLIYLGGRLVGPAPPRGWRAGVAVGAAGILLIVLLTAGFGHLLEALLGPQNAALGLGLTGAVGLGLLFLLVRSYFRPAFEKGLVEVEDQGWFTLVPYKKTQGQRVRRGTMLGVLAILLAGIWAHRTALTTATGHWELTVPFVGTRLLLLRDVAFTAPILLTFASLWLAYRVVNFPMFADFLIATEAEINKVSWASRKRLVQDTIVVLTTVVLVTAFIFFVDIFWGWGLRKVGVIQFKAPDRPASEQVDW